MICIVGNSVAACLLAMRLRLSGESDLLLVRRDGVKTFADPASFISQTCKWQIDALRQIGVPVYLDSEYECQHSVLYGGEIKTIPDFTMTRSDLEVMKAKHVDAWGEEHPDYSVQRTLIDFDRRILAEAMRDLLPIVEAESVTVNASTRSLDVAGDGEIRFTRADLCEYDRVWIDLVAPSSTLNDMPSQHIHRWEVVAADLPIEVLGADVIWDMSQSKIVRVMHGTPGSADLVIETLDRSADLSAFLDSLGVGAYTVKYAGRAPSPRPVEVVRWTYKSVVLRGPQFDAPWL